MKLRKVLILFFPIILIHLVYYYFLSQKHGLYIDEAFHFDQIQRFFHGSTQFNPTLMTLPGYHAVMAAIAILFKTTDVAYLRLVSLTFSLLSVAVFYFLGRRIDPKGSSLKTLQYAFLPILSVFFPLLYTDGFSNLVILLALFFAIRKNYFLSGIFSIGAVLVRQNNIFWLVFVNALIYIENNHDKTGMPRGTVKLYGFDMNIKRLKKHLRNSWGFILGLTAVFAVLILIKGVVVSGYAKGYVHLSLSLLNNVYFCLFFIFVLFIPLHLANLGKIGGLVKKERVKAAVIFILGLALFWVSFVRDHPFNTAPWFLHNAGFIFFIQDTLHEILFFSLVVLASLSLAVTPLVKKDFRLLYPFAFIYLLPYWLVEARYYIIPLTLFLLFRKPAARKIEYAMTGIFMIASTLLVYGTSREWFFP